MRFFFLCLFCFSLTVSLFAQNTDDLVIPPFQQAPERKPQFPLKTESMIYSDSLVFLAKENIRLYPWAKAIRDNILQEADRWLNFTEEELTVLMPDARVPRAFDISAKGCPVHGDTVFKIGGFYPWIIDPKHPFQVKCPVDSLVFPTNDYAAYYKSGFKDKIDWDTEYADDGWGWLSPEGERYWFVAHANEWIWGDHIAPGMLNLARAYLLTGDNRFASQAAFMLYRMASVYPSMNHEDQSRYGLLMKSRGIRYPGKISNIVTETNTIRYVAEAYDLVWKAIDTDLSLQKRTGKTGEELRAFIEANLLEDGLDAFEQEKILANYGWHQGAMLTVQLSRQHAGIEKAIHSMFFEPSLHPLKNGINYALYNQVFRDGIAWEPPFYNSFGLNSLMQIKERLPEGYEELLATFRFRQMFDAPLDMVAIGKYTPDIGDSGTTPGGLIFRAPAAYYQAYDLYRNSRYLPWINPISGQTKFDSIRYDSFRTLFHRPLPDFPALKGGRAVDIQPSRLFAGYGFGILNNPADETAVAFTYGKHYAHDHWDYLNIEVFAGGQKMMPDFGYPDAMNALVPGIFTWSKHTVSHNTVMVDQECQERKLPGVLHDFADGGFARTMDASSPAYGNASEYRRNVIMVDAEDGQSYLVDFFNVSGGVRHDYLLHGPPGKTYCVDDEWDAVSPDFDSPSPHFFNVRQLKSGKGILEFRHVSDEDARLRIFPLSTGDQEIFMADAYDKPRAKDHIVKNMICTRKTGGGLPLESMFASVLELYQGEKHILADARLAKLDIGNGHVVAVERGDVTDMIIYDPSGSKKKIDHYNLQTDAVSTVATFDKSGKLIRVFFSCGSYLHCQGQKFTAIPVKGKVVSVDVLKRTLLVEMEESSKIRTKDISGQIAHFTNDFRTTVHPLSSMYIAKNRLEIKVKDDFLIGYFRVQKNDGNILTPDHNFMPFYQDYSGATILDKNYRPASVITDLQEGMRLKEPVALSLKPGDEAWICNIGTGEQFLIKPVFFMKKNKNH